MVIHFIFYHPQLRLQSPWAYIREKPPRAHVHVRDRARVSRCVAIQRRVFPRSSAGCICTARLEPCWPPLFGGQFGRAHPLQEGGRVLLYSQKTEHTVCPQSGLLPGLFANTDVAAVCLADPLPGRVPSALSHTVGVSFPRITRAGV